MSFCVVPCSVFARRALLVGDRDVEREQPRRRRVDGHRGVHVGERDALEQRAHVAEMGDRHADLADLAAREHVVGVVAGLGRQIEGDRKAGLALGEVLAVERVRLARRSNARHRCGKSRACRVAACRRSWRHPARRYSAQPASTLIVHRKMPGRKSRRVPADRRLGRPS